MTLWRTYYHFVWATYQRQALLTDDREALLYPYIKTKAKRLECNLHAIGGVADHIHLVVSIPPKLAIAEFVQKIKASSSHYLNHVDGLSNGEKSFAWQREYGVFTLGGQQLARAIAYAEKQKHHHAKSTIIRALEPDVLVDYRLSERSNVLQRNDDVDDE
jgi:putative transposase